MRIFSFYLVIIVFIFSCKPNNKSANTVVKEIKTEEAVDEVALEYPVYDFESLTPFLSKKDNKTYIINFWATWCKPCIEELPFFEKTFEEQKENNVELILVSLDMPSMWKSRLVPFVEKRDLKGQVVILDDPKMNDWIPKLDKDWEGGIPATLIYNKEKRAFYAKGFTYEELNTELNKFLN